MPTIISDFFEDVRKDAEATLAGDGVNVPAGMDVHRTLVEVFHFKQRVLRPMPRTVVWSKELRARQLTADQHTAVGRIARELEQGADTRRRMTKQIRTAGYNDGLLTDWGIHHMHIGEKVGPDGFIERGGPLLFVFVVGGTAYLLDLLDHGAFADEELIEILHGNWPEVMAARLAPGFVPGSLSPKLTSAQRKKMRQKFTFATETKDGTIYVPPGGGIVTSGHSVMAVDEANRILNLVHPAEEWAREHADWMATQIERGVGRRPDELHLRFATWHSMRVGVAIVQERASNVLFAELPPQPGTEPQVWLPTI